MLVTFRAFHPMWWPNPLHLDTEIDWETYMIQTKVFLSGEHNYSRITGPTGPLV